MNACQHSQIIMLATQLERMYHVDSYDQLRYANARNAVLTICHVSRQDGNGSISSQVNVVVLQIICVYLHA